MDPVYQLRTKQSLSTCQQELKHTNNKLTSWRHAFKETRQGSLLPFAMGHTTKEESTTQGQMQQPQTKE
jgi:hypothetical protein